MASLHDDVSQGLGQRWHRRVGVPSNVLVLSAIRAGLSSASNPAHHGLGWAENPHGAWWRCTA
jgi:hypothetical protein